jgi:hypothetical protein
LTELAKRERDVKFVFAPPQARKKVGRRDPRVFQLPARGAEGFSRRSKVIFLSFFAVAFFFGLRI